MVAGTAAPCLPDPDSFLQITFGKSLGGLIRRQPKLHESVRRAKYILEGRHQPTDTTVAVIAQAFASFFSPEATKAVLRGQMAEHDLPPFLPWRELQRALGPIPGDTRGWIGDTLVAYLVDRESFYARLVHHEKAGRASMERRSLEEQLQQGLSAWKVLNPRLTASTVPLVEELLRCIAWLDVHLQPAHPGKSAFAPFLAPSRRPMGHWLHEVGCASNARSIAKLAKRLQELDVLYKGDNKEDPYIKVDLLKKWSASQKLLMPVEALQPVLTGVSPDHRPQLEGRYYLARWLSFLVDLVRAGTQGDAPEWKEAQDQVRCRYTEAYRIELTAQIP